MNNFRTALERKIKTSMHNNYGNENYDELRFGPRNKVDESLFLRRIKSTFKSILNYRPEAGKKKAEEVLSQISALIPNFEKLFSKLNKEDQKLLLALVAYRTMGFSRVMLPRNNKEYREALTTAKTLIESEEKYHPNYLHFVLDKFNLAKIGFPIQLFFSELAIAIDFIIEQYAYKRNGETVIEVQNGDTVLDVGGCWGDTALYFAYKAGEKGNVFSFEFIPNNIKLHNINTALNPTLQNRIKVIPIPVLDKSNIPIYYKDAGPSSRVSTKQFEGQTGATETISIDDFVKQNKIEKVDFIKMDIEGSETLALHGAIETIKKFKPTLAIAIYHSMEELVNIPCWIIDLQLNYELYLGHYTIQAEETIIFAKVKS